jgi:hypothetical protein
MTSLREQVCYIGRDVVPQKFHCAQSAKKLIVVGRTFGARKRYRRVQKNILREVPRSAPFLQCRYERNAVLLRLGAEFGRKSRFKTIYADNADNVRFAIVFRDVGIAVNHSHNLGLTDVR